jgi:hypothetical protein
MIISTAVSQDNIKLAALIFFAFSLIYHLGNLILYQFLFRSVSCPTSHVKLSYNHFFTIGILCEVSQSARCCRSRCDAVISRGKHRVSRNDEKQYSEVDRIGEAVLDSAIERKNLYIIHVCLANQTFINTVIGLSGIPAELCPAQHLPCSAGQVSNLTLEIVSDNFSPASKA